jgi:6-phosphogluconolactonase
MITAERYFADRQRLAVALAVDIASRLRQLLDANGKAVLAVSGGTTPGLFFDWLSQADIDWAKVTVTLVDERQVPETSERSNARLVKTRLLQNKAAAARFVPLYDNPQAVDCLPLDIAILGMGNDGHTASFFPGGDTLAEAIDPATTRKLIALSAPGSGEPRLTFTLPVLLAASHHILHIEGSTKRATLDRALTDGPVEDMPIRAVLRSATPLTLYWCKT